METQSMMYHSIEGMNRKVRIMAMRTKQSPKVIRYFFQIAGSSVRTVLC